MKIDRQDLFRLRWALPGTLLLIAGSAGLAWHSFSAHQAATRQHALAERDFQSISAQLRQVNSEEQELREKARRFQELKTRGILAPASRLDWSEQLAQARREGKSPHFEYFFSPQREWPESIAGHRFVSSDMKLRLHLLHEGELLRTLATLRDQASALIELKSCRLNRIPPPANNALAQLEGNCEMSWINIIPAGGK